MHSRQPLSPEIQTSIRSWLPGAIEIAREAGQIILNIYESEFKINSKEDNTPVTCADLAANELIVKKLSELTPDIPILSEESTEIPYEERRHWETYWLVDPLDGTRAFIERTGEFSVNIALVHQHYPVIGVIYSPVKRCSFYACSGSGAFYLNKHDQATAIQVRSCCPKQITVAGTRSSRSEALLGYLKK